MVFVCLRVALGWPTPPYIPALLCMYACLFVMVTSHPRLRPPGNHFSNQRLYLLRHWQYLRLSRRKTIMDVFFWGMSQKGWSNRHGDFDGSSLPWVGLLNCDQSMILHSQEIDFDHGMITQLIKAIKKNSQWNSQNEWDKVLNNQERLKDC